MCKMRIEVLISQSFKNKRIIIENKFDLFGHKRCKRQLHVTITVLVSFVRSPFVVFSNL